MRENDTYARSEWLLFFFIFIVPVLTEPVQMQTIRPRPVLVVSRCPGGE